MYNWQTRKSTIILSQCLEMQQISFGINSNHASMADTFDHMGVVFLGQGKIDEAEELYLIKWKVGGLFMVMMLFYQILSSKSTLFRTFI